MSTDWSTFKSFQETQGLLEAISTIVLWHQIASAGVSPPPTLSREGIADAADHVREFVEFLSDAADAVSDVRRPLLGASARTLDLARRFAAARRMPNEFHSDLFRHDVDRVLKLLKVGPDIEGEDRRDLLNSLQELQALLDVHVHDDAVRLLGTDF